VHIRLTGSIVEVALKAKQYNVRFFQCFFVLQATGKLAHFSTKEIQEFVQLRRTYFDQLYLHGSYWINLASSYNAGIASLERELAYAKQLEFTHIILHPGSAKGFKTRLDGIDILAHHLNQLLKKERDIQFVLENTAHGNVSVGSDITDFAVLLQKMEEPERLAFCIDTSHAFAYGYDIVNDLDGFIDLLDKTIGINTIVVIHMNDTKEKLGSHIDRHAIPGEGLIGDYALRRFIMHPRMQHIPVLMELPVLTEEKELEILHKVNEWTM
jgi:deoxyribonuclease-4